MIPAPSPAPYMHLLPLIFLLTLLPFRHASGADPGSEPHVDTGLPTAWAEPGLPGPGVGLSGGAGYSYRPSSLVPSRLVVVPPSLELAFPLGRLLGLHVHVPLTTTIAEAILVPGRLRVGLDAFLVRYHRPQRGGFDIAAGPGLGLRVISSPGLRQVEGKLLGRIGVESPSIEGRFRAGVFLEPWLTVGSGTLGLELAGGLSARLLARWHGRREP